jgi:hypothetical protein
MNPKETITDLAERVLAGTATPDECKAVASWALATVRWIRKQREVRS